jgi:hypothetical protein
MKTCKEMRLENARSLAAGNPASFSKKLAMSGQQANALIGPNPSRGIGDEKAREIERAYKKEIGWLDHDHDSSDIDSANTGQYNALSKQALDLISCVSELDSVGGLARSAFILHTGLLRLSSASSELHTGSARAEMIAEIQRLIGSGADTPGATDDRKPKTR